MPVKYVDAANIALITISCALAHIFPYHLLLFSYAVLGPAHYLTQISWLHDRRYFVDSRLIAPSLLALTLLLVVCFFRNNSIFSSALVLTLAFGLAFVFTLPAITWMRLAGLATLVAVLAAEIYAGQLAIFIAVFLPTVLHVFVFTACFMWVGAMKSHKTSAYIALGALLVGAVTFLIPHNITARPVLDGIMFFKPIADYVQRVTGISEGTEQRVFGFLSFAYTYHYLNWFSKAEVIHWNRIPRRRLYAIVAVYMIAIGIYFYNYIVGFVIILFLAQAHVLLEFPLNIRTFAVIAGSFRKQKPA